ncbi:uncharacterized protein KY384_006630 [Bacidia gigantensis]|uniref:uncharacterized protein n=1 Tax=Bacidia gigantensis TaxID=2732470 RepID=UPI001D053124|nr:uncharacterized protein KY384_006630 [Bacidia gigantensis]KAG8528941.1 hypothetical protein KY384_006630 [Bacidia gigantensis]
MTDTTRQADALLTDHFTYTPLSLIDDIINAVNTIVYQALDALEDGLLKVPPAQLGFKPTPTSQTPSAADAAKDEIENGVHQLETLLESTVDKDFDKFELFTLRNSLSVPEDLGGYMRLRHYEDLPLPLPTNTLTPESITSLHRQVQETKKLNLALKAKHARNGAMIAQLQSLLSPPPPPPSASQTLAGDSKAPAHSLAFITQGSQNPSGREGGMTTQAQFATSQLPALRELVAKLRPEIEKLSRLGEDGEDGKKEERRRYIESGVRRVVGKSGVGGGGGVGEGDLGGRGMVGERRGREEVEGLEGLVRGVRGEGGGSAGEREDDRMEI